MDTIDAKIINLLIQNSRMNASEIAENVKLSVSAVIERIKKLEISGVIRKYTLVLNNALIGKDVMAMISISVEHPRYNQAFEEAIRANKHVVECNYIAGDVDYLLKVIVTNTQSLERLLFEIKSLQGVSKTKTNIILSSIKDEHSMQIKATKK